VIIVCSWCKKVQGEKEPLKDRRNTHTICSSCFEVQKMEMEEFFRKMTIGPEGEALIVPQYVPAAESAAG
jgi:hypothetical protein